MSSSLCHAKRFIAFGAGVLFMRSGFATIDMHMVSASQRRSCCCLSNIFDGCPR
jgi:hypothetical protein